VPSCKISSKSAKRFLRYHDFFIFKMADVRHLGSPPKDKKLRKLSGWPIWAHNYGLKINAVKYENSHDAAPVCALFVPNCAHPTGGAQAKSGGALLKNFMALRAGRDVPPHF